MADRLTSTVQVGVSVLLWRNSHEFLVGLRKGSHGAGEWWLPGGKPGPGEHPATAALRELTEETGLTDIHHVTPLKMWTYDKWEDFDRHFVCVYYSAALYSGEPVVMEPDKCDEWRWVTWSTVPEPYNWSIELARMELERSERHIHGRID